MNNLEQSAVAVSRYIERLRRDRGRFVALDFCAADLLLEVNASREIVFAAGASHSLIGKPPESLVGMAFLDLVVPENVPLIAELLKGMKPGSRLYPIPLKLVGANGDAVLTELHNMSEDPVIQPPGQHLKVYADAVRRQINDTFGQTVVSMVILAYADVNTFNANYRRMQTGSSKRCVARKR